MKQLNRAEAHVLYRMLYLLEEKSVKRLMEQDENFEKYITDMYATINSKYSSLNYPESQAVI